jgi:hypothetical protein
MAIVRRATNMDATWQRGWTADALSDLATVTGTGPGKARRGDVAYVTAEAAYYTFRDDGTWEATGSGVGGAYKPLTTGAEPMVLVSDGAGAPVMVAFTP